MKEITMIVCGVGGQGVLLLSEIVGKAALAMGFDVRTTETYGLSQRGGAVTSHVRIGGVIYSPLIGEGEAHYMIALEPLEALRNIKYCSKKTCVILNERQIHPVPVLIGRRKYPQLRLIIETLEKRSKKVYSFNMSEIAVECGSEIYQNSVALGFFAALEERTIPLEVFKGAMEELIPAACLEGNLMAFYRGYKLAEERLKAE